MPDKQSIFHSPVPLMSSSNIFLFYNAQSSTEFPVLTHKRLKKVLTFKRALYIYLCIWTMSGFATRPGIKTMHSWIGQLESISDLPQ